MSIQQRRERERAERHRLIVDAARDLAESEGWDAVTTRRLAERVEYSQPVLYSHFKGKDAIVRAVAVDGFAVLAGLLRTARTGKEGAAALRATAETYLDFAAERPALYDAMFVQRVDIPFGTAETPAELRAAFEEFVATVAPLAGHRDPETLIEVFWSSLHGLATLTAGRRLRPDHHRARLDLLLTSLLNHPEPT
ncbi:TetR/AcrR family transcriptional regulator [Actinosynnema sp. NPDC047251]|uniref:Transcriptional regulator, TetR family n=1 Tax=Saccharothrix espanaensis (strain ATCC 51144 / DSM 44229 / JCM 9112 / NBRC 15066 / NRRL 15764) TaxID=1179773 RepID=K0K699_SACES|nr:TetR/AcrR family transcriptional regulator [Saccharothrix espanaensis]CCH33052.1 Transcriptional regulator, TetR family [Saccharothrix espanaensis DSM 44229]